MHDRQGASCHDQTTIPFARERTDAAFDLACVSDAHWVQFHPQLWATDWIAPNWPLPAATAASRSTTTRVTLGTICLSSSSHFPLMPYSYKRKPVTLPPGRARLSTTRA